MDNTKELQDAVHRYMYYNQVHVATIAVLRRELTYTNNALRRKGKQLKYLRTINTALKEHVFNSDPPQPTR